MTDHHTSTNGSGPRPVQSYLIASTPRSGSTLLCEALTNTGVAGRPEEYYQHRRDAIFAEGTYHVAYEPQRCIRTPRWKYVRRFDERTGPVPSNTDDSPSKDLWMATGWPANLLAQEQLYDLLLDPNEADNLIATPEGRLVADGSAATPAAVDGAHPRSAPAGPGGAPGRSRVQRPGRPLGGRPTTSRLNSS